MTAYYNENDPFAAAWLRELMKDGLIAPGWVDERSIADVRPEEVQGFTQCHFFAGVGIWSLALRLAGWGDDRPVWTGSAPCQPFSNAGKGEGFDDERHLWPTWFKLIASGKRSDVPILGEQVASKDGRAWFDLVSGDMQTLDHACGAVDISAAGLGAPFIGQRLYWLASSDSGQCEQQSSGRSADLQREASGASEQWQRSSDCGTGFGGLASSDSGQCNGRTDSTGGDDRRGQNTGWPEGDGRSPVCDGFGGLASPTSGQPRHGDLQPSGQHRLVSQDLRDCGDGGVPLHPTEYWRDADWLLCRDPNGARFRPVEPPTQRMADAGAVGRSVVDRSGTGRTHFPLCEKTEYKNRLNEVRGFGNALNVSQAVCFIEAVMEWLEL